MHTNIIGVYETATSISSEGAVELETALYKNTTLRELNLSLSGNSIGEHVGGVTALATMLAENKSLTWLELEDCHISGQGGGKLAAAMIEGFDVGTASE